MEEMVGLLITTVPVRARVGGSRRVAEVLDELQAQVVESQRYGYAPLTEIRAQSGVEAGEPLFHSLLVFENFPVDEDAGDGWELSVEHASGVERTNYPLVVVSAPGERLHVRLQYDRRQFGERAMERMGGHLGTLLRG